MHGALLHLFFSSYLAQVSRKQPISPTIFSYYQHPGFGWKSFCSRILEVPHHLLARKSRSATLLCFMFLQKHCQSSTSRSGALAGNCLLGLPCLLVPCFLQVLQCSLSQSSLTSLFSCFTFLSMFASFPCFTISPLDLLLSLPWLIPASSHFATVSFYSLLAPSIGTAFRD